jgi:hypothetical protein
MNPRALNERIEDCFLFFPTSFSKRYPLHIFFFSWELVYRSEKSSPNCSFDFPIFELSFWRSIPISIPVSGQQWFPSLVPVPVPRPHQPRNMATMCRTPCLIRNFPPGLAFIKTCVEPECKRILIQLIHLELKSLASKTGKKQFQFTISKAFWKFHLHRWLTVFMYNVWS